ncbi:MAG: flagellar hook-basal body complex protein FliE [Ignavibacteria bacterium]
MPINPIQNIFSEIPQLQQTTKKPDTSGSFGEMLTSFVGDVNNQQLESGKLTRDFAEGKQVELHEVMIAGEKAKTNFELLMEIRNKSIDMYKELTRMPI